jgi:hypothetical protein
MTGYPISSEVSLSTTNQPCAIDTWRTIKTRHPRQRLHADLPCSSHYLYKMVMTLVSQAVLDRWTAVLVSAVAFSQL